MTTARRTFVRWALVTCAVGVGASAFQNCARLEEDPLTDVGLIGFSSVKSDADLAWSLRSTTLPTVGRLGRVSRWLDGKTNQVALYPPNMPNSMALDLGRAPSVEQTATGSILRFGDNQNLSIQYGDVPRFVADAYTIAMYVRELKISVDGAQYLRLIQVVPNDLSDSGSLIIDLSITDGVPYIYAHAQFSNAITSARVKLAPGDLDGGLGIVASFPSDTQRLRLAVNGVISEPVITNGTSPLLGITSRRPYLHGFDGQLAGVFKFADLGIWLRASSDQDLTMNSFALRRSLEIYGTAQVPSAEVP